MKKLDQHDVFDLEVLIRLANRQIDICRLVIDKTIRLDTIIVIVCR
jgi:hypothetical protein